MSNFKAVVFDMDGTLLDNENIAKMFWRDASLEFGLKVEEEFLDQMIGASAVFVKENYFKVFGPDCPYEAIRERKTEVDLAYYLENGAPVKVGAIEVLDYLRNTAQVPLALATSTERKRTTLRMDVSGLGKFFDFIICGDEVKEAKPSPEIYQKTFKALNVLPSEVLVVEDSTSGVHAAIQAGANVAWIKDSLDIRSDLRAGLWKELTDLRDLLHYF